MSDRKWTIEDLHELFFEKFGLTLADEELNEQWALVPSRTLTPRGDKMNIGVSPLWLITNLERELSRTGLTIKDPRFKKMREEIIPAIDYVLFLKKLGFGEHVITSSDNPDIILMNKDNNKIEGSAYKRRAIPIEVTFINDEAAANVVGKDGAEKIVAVLEKNKLNKNYGKHTTLLVVIDTEFQEINLEKITELLKGKGKNFHEITLWISENNESSVMACVYPLLATHTLNPVLDLDPLMY